jgi:ParB/RepB/Spo0J family partition protein
MKPTVDTSAPKGALTFQELPISQLHTWPGNPRKHWNKTDDSELAENVRAHGVIEPLIARPSTSVLSTIRTFEIIAGERRYRAAKTAGIATLPVVIRELTDSQAIEFALSENGHRNNLHPLDEASAFAELQRLAPATTVEQLAAHHGRSVRYVKDSLALLGLVGEAKTALEDGRITVTHARKIARLDPSLHTKAVDACFTREFDYDSGADQMVLAPVRRLEDWISNNVRLDPKSEEAQEEFPELISDIAKAEAVGATVLMLTEKYLRNQYPVRKGQPGDPLWHERWEEVKAADGRAQLGVIVEGRRRGKTIHVALIEERKPSASTKTPASRPTNSPAEREAAKLAKAAEERRLAAEKAKRDREVLVLKRAALAAAAAQTGVLKERAVLTLIADALRGADTFDDEVLTAVATELKVSRDVFRWGRGGTKALAKLTPKQLTAVIVIQALGIDRDSPAAFKAVGIDLKKIDLMVKKELDAKAQPAKVAKKGKKAA